MRRKCNEEMNEYDVMHEGAEFSDQYERSSSDERADTRRIRCKPQKKTRSKVQTKPLGKLVNKLFSSKMSPGKSKTAASIEETSRKVDASVLPAIESMISSSKFSKENMLDFLDVKNSLMTSYMIDLTLYVKNRNIGKVDVKNIRRLTEMKVVLDKMRGLDKKLRYQIEKLLNSATSASTFASAGDNFGPEDPLQFRANPESLEEKEVGSSNGSVASGSEDSKEGAREGEEDDDLAAARMTLSLSRNKKKSREDEADSELYQAPRLAAVPYTHDVESRQKEKEKRNKRRLRATELAQTLRAEYGEAPEQEDMHGGSDYGKQRAAARRLAEREAEKIRAEEEGMVRLMTSRKDKKEKKRILRMESSNLGAISDLSNLVRETRDFGRESGSDDDDVGLPPASEDLRDRHHNGKRVRGRDDIYGERLPKRRGKPGKTKNTLQAALYSTQAKKKSKKSKR